MEKRIEVRNGKDIDLIRASQVNMISLSNEVSHHRLHIGGVSGNSSRVWCVGEGLFNKPTESDIAYNELKDLVKEIEKYVFDEVRSERKMIIDFGEKKELVHSEFANVTFILSNDIEPLYEIEDELVWTNGSVTTTSFVVRVNDTEKMTEDEIEDEAVRILTSRIGEQKGFDDIQVQTFPAEYKTTYVRTSYKNV